MKISIICSVYNASKYLINYLNMANDQLLKEFEIIFVDANSTDNSLDLIESFKFRNGIEVKILPQKERVTIYDAWNIAIKESTCHYVMNWNTDDLLFPNALLTYQNYIKSFPDVDVFYSPCGIVNKHSFDAYTGISNWPQYSHDTLLQLCICGPFPLLRKSAVEACGYFNPKYISSGDYEMWLKLSKNKYTFKKIPDIIGSFLYRADSTSNQKIKKAQKEDLEIQELYR